MAKSRLAEILKQEYKTKGIGSGTVSAIGKSLKEKMDLRNVLFGGSGIGSVIGRKIFGKGYSATPESSVATKISTPEQTFSNEAVTVLSTIATHSATSAKNSIVLPSMARDMHLVKQNIAKLVKLGGGTPQTKAGDWLSRQMARETAYEESLKKTAPTPMKIDDKKKETDNPLLKILGGLASSISSVIGKVTDAIKDVLLLSVRGIAGLLATTLTGPLFIGALVAAAIAALYNTPSVKDWRRQKELEGKKESDLTDSEKVELQDLKEKAVARNVEATTNYQKSGEFGDDMMKALGLPTYDEPTPAPAPAQPTKQSTTPEPVKTDGLSLLNKVMDKEGVTDPITRERIIKLAMVESSMRPNATGPTIQSGMHKGDSAKGLLQIMPKTAAELGYKPEDLNDPEKAAEAGVKYFLKNLKKFNGDLNAATVAHHAGPGGAEKFLKTGSIGTKDVATGISTMDYLNKVSGSSLASASTEVASGQRQMVSVAPANVVVDNSVKTNNMSSPQNAQIASAYNQDFNELLAYANRV